MSQKITRLLTILITGFITLAVMVGATYLYNKMVYTDPLKASVTKLSSIESIQVEQLTSRSKIKVQFNLKEKLRANFYLLLDQLEGQNFNDPENLTIEIENGGGQELRQFLTKARLPVYEALSTGRFTELPAHLNTISEEVKVNYDLEIDNSFVFITANYGSESAHMIINRGESPLNIVNTLGGEYL